MRRPPREPAMGICRAAAEIAVTATAAVLDPILGAIARVDEARRQWEVAIKLSAEWHFANVALGQAQNVVLATVPSSLRGIRELIAYARREG